MGRQGRRRWWPPLLAAAVLAVSLPVAFAYSLSALGVPLLESGAQPASADEAAAEPPALAVLADSPATLAITGILADPPVPGWRALAPVEWAVGSPYDYACQLGGLDGPRPAVSAQRLFTDGTLTVAVTAHAYGAGAGAVAYDQWRAAVQACPQRESTVSVLDSTVSGTGAVVGRLRPEGSPETLSTVTWRRGDVVLTVHAGAARDTDLSAVATAVDARAVGALTGTCANLMSTAEDAARSPWVSRDGYTGLLARESVAVPPTPLPTPPAGVPARDPSVPLEPLPEVTPPAVTPSPPLWPPAPTPVPTPVLPTNPGPQPTSTEVGVPREDPMGPGCGWAFTRQVAPPFDASGAAQARAAALTRARDDLLVAQAQWTRSIVEFWSGAAAYESQLGTYRLYATRIQQVTVAWAALQAARDQYALALVEWKRLLAERTALITAQQAAARDYQAALAACAAQPTAEPSPTPVTPSPTGDPTGTPTADPSASPTTSPIIDPTPPPTVPTPTLVCPPERPPALDATIPPIPPTPTPPPDPRPSASASPAVGR